MRAFVTALVASALVGVSTQTTLKDLPFDIDISAFDVSTLNGWCSAQIHVCDTLCDNDTEANSCLPGPPPVWNCICQSNSSAPGAQYYSTSMEAILCQQAFGQCQSQNAGDAQAQRSKCVQGIQSTCGNNDIADFGGASGGSPKTATATATSTTAASSNTASSAAASHTNDDHDDFAPSLPVFATSGLVVMMAGLFAQLL